MKTDSIKRLVIVESPTKAKTIRKFLPSKLFQIEASMGHVRDLPAGADAIPPEKKKAPWKHGINTETFEPVYVIPSDKKKIVRALESALKDADELYIATDEDREGESIGWHLLQVLKPKVPVQRMVFHEITQEAITAALEHTRQIDENLVDAQETRRILDRLVGYELSPVLWRKIAPRLSAGRVQSVAVRLLVMREKERIEFVPATYWDLKAALAKEESPFEAVLTHLGGVRVASGRDFDESTGRLKTSLKENVDVRLVGQELASRMAAEAQRANWQVAKVEEKQGRRSPAAPFTTSTLQQDASRKLGLSARDTMRVAQKLYENGFITYMRTDSTNLSQEAIDASRKAVGSRYGNEYLSPEPRQYATKSRNAQEAHEAIRPAGKEMKTRDDWALLGVEGALYDLIWKRTVATQMAEARLRFVTATLEVTAAGEAAIFRASGRTTEFPGFLRAYVEGSDDPDAVLEEREQPLPPLAAGQKVNCAGVEAQGHETKPPARFTEASLIQLLEKEGIGRPSTYASIIDTIVQRGYVRRNGGQLAPTFTAFATNRLLEKQFEKLVDIGFTAGMEQDLDDIASGSTKAKPYLTTFYSGLQEMINSGVTVDPREISTLEVTKWLPYIVRVGKFGPYVEGEVNGAVARSSLPIDWAPGDVSKAMLEDLLTGKSAGDKSFGKLDGSDLEIFLRRGPYGWYIQLGTDEQAEKKKKPKRVSLPPGVLPDELTTETATAVISLPRKLGVREDTSKDIMVNVGRFGPYVQHGSTFASLAKTDNVLTIEMPRAMELLLKKEGRSLPVRVLGPHPVTNETVDIREGRYGPFVQHEGTKASLPRDRKIEDLTMEEAVELLAAKDASGTGKKKTRTRAAATQKAAPKAKSAAKKATAKTAKKTGAKKAPAKKKTKKV